MERGFRKQEDPNCQCQCHFPNNIICQVTSCCHCIYDYNNSNNYSGNYNDRFYLSNSNPNYFKDGINQDLMNSCSTNFRSGNESFNSQNSLFNNISNKKNYYTMRKIQNQDLLQSKLQRNFSDPHFNNINNDSYINNNNYSNMIQQDPYKNNRESFYKKKYNNNSNNNNTIRMNEPINPLTQSNNNNNIRLNEQINPLTK